MQREVELGGPIHSKGVLILASFLAARYSGKRPHSLRASIVFEQTYGDGRGRQRVDGRALRAACPRSPTRRSASAIAITGSVNQSGEMQAIGAVNEKIEGFFDICKARGLTGRQAVVIPESNVKNLMLRADVIAAAAAGQVPRARGADRRRGGRDPDRRPRRCAAGDRGVPGGFDQPAGRRPAARIRGGAAGLRRHPGRAQVAGSRVEKAGLSIMSAPAAARRFARVLVPLAASARGEAALDAAVGLAAAVGARLEGLFVEDANLARLCALPFAREVSPLTTTHRLLEPADIERAFRVEAARLQQILERRARQARIECSFDVTRGQLLAEAIARDADLTVLMGRERHRAGEREPARRTRGAMPASVAVIFDASAASLRGLAAATGLARMLERELLILVPRGGAATEPSATERSAGEQARDWLVAEGVAGAAVTLAPTRDALYAAVRIHGGSLLALPAATLAAFATDLAALAADAPCTLILVR